MKINIFNGLGLCTAALNKIWENNQKYSLLKVLYFLVNLSCLFDIFGPFPDPCGLRGSVSMAHGIQ